MRERDRYPRKTLRERLGDIAGWPRAHRTSTIVLLALLAMMVVWKIVTPEYVLWTDMRTGDCLYVSADQTVPVVAQGQIFSPANGDQAILSEYAERAACGLSHSHEVLDAFVLPEPAGAPYPGRDALAAEVDERCRAAFAAYVGRPVETSRYRYRIVMPLEGFWALGNRAGLCLLFDGTKTFMDHPARGSGE